MMWPLLLKRTATAPRQRQAAPLSPARSPKSEEESQTAVKEDVKQLRSTPSLRISFQRHGSIARDSLLRDGKLLSLIDTKEPVIKYRGGGGGGVGYEKLVVGQEK